jgi:hypothetical protein
MSERHDALAQIRAALIHKLEENVNAQLRTHIPIDLYHLIMISHFLINHLPLETCNYLDRPQGGRTPRQGVDRGTSDAIAARKKQLY